MTLKHRVPRNPNTKEFKRVKIFNPNNWSMFGDGSQYSIIDFIVEKEEVILYHIKGIMPLMEDVMAVLLQDRHVRRAIQDRERVAINEIIQYNYREGQSGREYWNEVKWYINNRGKILHPEKICKPFLQVSSSGKLDFDAEKEVDGAIHIPINFIKWLLIKDFKNDVANDNGEVNVDLFPEWYREFYARNSVKRTIRSRGVRIKYIQNRNLREFLEGKKLGTIVNMYDYKF